MRAVLQRVSRAQVTVGGEIVGAISRGLCILVGVEDGDGEEDRAYLLRKIPKMRIFPDDAGKMNLSVVDVGASVLLVSQFTLCADTRKGTRPSFAHAMEPTAAKELFDKLAAEMAKEVPVQTGEFGASMLLELVNDGPVTIILDSRSRG